MKTAESRKCPLFPALCGPSVLGVDTSAPLFCIRCARVTSVLMQIMQGWLYMYPGRCVRRSGSGRRRPDEASPATPAEDAPAAPASRRHSRAPGSVAPGPHPPVNKSGLRRWVHAREGRYRWVPICSDVLNPNCHLIASPKQTHLLSPQC